MGIIGLKIRLSRALLCTALFWLIPGGSAYAGDSCITCHTDEELLEEFLADTENKTSALQAGSG